MDKDLRRLMMGAIALGYLESVMNFTSKGIFEDEFLSAINGAVSKNMGLIKAGLNGEEKNCHVYAFLLTLYERWSARSYSLEEGFDVHEYHYIFWASVNALFIKYSNSQDFFIKIHQIAMTYYLAIPSHPEYEKEAAKLFINTSKLIRKENVLNELSRLLKNIDLPMRMIGTGSKVKNVVAYYCKNPNSVISALNVVNAPGNLFNLIQKPLINDNHDPKSSLDKPTIVSVPLKTKDFNDEYVDENRLKKEVNDKEIPKNAPGENDSISEINLNDYEKTSNRENETPLWNEGYTKAAEAPYIRKEPLNNKNAEKKSKPTRLRNFLVASLLLTFVCSLFSLLPKDVKKSDFTVNSNSKQASVRAFDHEKYMLTKKCLEQKEYINAMSHLAVYKKQKDELRSKQSEFELNCSNLKTSTPEYQQASEEIKEKIFEIGIEVKNRFDRLKPSSTTYKKELMPKNHNGLPSVYAAQKKMQKLGYEVQPDGIYGAKTANAIREFQKRCGLTITGTVSKELLIALDERISNEEIK